MDQSKPNMQTTPSPASPQSQPVSIVEVVKSHGTQLTQLNTLLDAAFTNVNEEITGLQTSSRQSTSALADLSAQVSALTEALKHSTLKGITVGDEVEKNFSLFDQPAASQSESQDPRREPKFPCPKSYEGDFSLCKGFLGQCELFFRHQPIRYRSQETRIALVMSLLSGRALQWAIAVVGRNSRLATNYAAFIQEFRLVFDHPVDGPDAASRLHGIRQGARSVADYTVEFRILAAESTWDDAALKSAYRRGLGETIKDLILQKQPPTLDALIALALQADDRLRERNRERARAGAANKLPSVKSSSKTPGGDTASTPVSSLAFTSLKTRDEPMEMGKSRLSAEERERRMSERLCLYCSEGGHVIRSCPIRPKDRAR